MSGDDARNLVKFIVRGDKLTEEIQNGKSSSTASFHS